ncbi:MAG: hypothetical protein Q8O41_10305 [Candidatus Methanoperedens sp.]|nr:hypothetical protein [Candidatus Methanoperedens sp.]
MFNQLRLGAEVRLVPEPAQHRLFTVAHIRYEAAPVGARIGEGAGGLGRGRRRWGGGEWVVGLC